MKIEINRETFASQFSLASAIAPQRSPKPILNNVKLDAGGTQVIISATDLETGVRITAHDVKVDKQGSVVVPVTRFGLILKEATDENLTIEVGTDGAQVTGKDSEYHLPVQDPDEFPGIPEVDSDNSIEVPSRVMKQLIKRSVFAADTESTRFALSGVKFEFTEEGEVTAIGTDGRRLAKMSGKGVINGKAPSADQVTIVPSKALQQLDRSLPDDDTPVKITPGDNDMSVRCGDNLFYTHLVEGRFPKWRDIFDSGRESVKVEMMVGTLHTALRQAAIVVDAETRGVDFTFETGKLTLRSRAAEVGESTIERPITYEGQTIGICLDQRFFTDMLRVLPQDSMIKIDIQSAEAAAYIDTDDGYSYVIMPLARESR